MKTRDLNGMLEHTYMYLPCVWFVIYIWKTWKSMIVWTEYIYMG